MMLRNWQIDTGLAPLETGDIDSLTLTERFEYNPPIDSWVLTLSTKYEGKVYAVGQAVSEQLCQDESDREHFRRVLHERCRYQLDLAIFGQDRAYEQGYRDGFYDRPSYPVEDSLADTYRSGFEDGIGDRALVREEMQGKTLAAQLEATGIAMRELQEAFLKAAKAGTPRI